MIKKQRRILKNQMFEEARGHFREARFAIDGGLYYMDSEINQMSPGDWRPSRYEVEKNPEENEKFRNPGISPVRFPNFPDAQLIAPRGSRKAERRRGEWQAKRWTDWRSDS